LLLAMAILITGCGPRRERVSVQRMPLPDQDATTLMIVVDLSGSFQQLMAEDGKAWELTIEAIDKYMRERAGASPDDQILLANISGARKSLMWQGTPRSFRKDFQTKEKFRNFLQSKADPQGSLVHDGIAHAVEYMSAHPRLQNSNGKSVILICSDMLDNGPEPEKSELRLMSALTSYLQKGGVVSIYYCDQLEYAKWRQKFTDAGFASCAIECDFHGKPTLPDLQ
jgi:hypothetical protein